MAEETGRALAPDEVLAAVPQREPFRFIDEIREIDEDHVVAAYRFPSDAPFYRGHFPGRPITPGVLVLEAMAQAGVVALGIYLLAKQLSAADASRHLAIFTDANVEFSRAVTPGEVVVTTGRKVFFRRLKLRSEVEARLEDGSLVAHGVVAGIGVPG